MSAPKESTDIGKDIVTDNEWRRNKEPNQSFQDVIDDKVALKDDK